MLMSKGADMTLETRARRREPTPAYAELALNEATAKAIKLSLPLSSIEGKDKVYIKVHLIDISISGCAINSPYLIPQGILIDLKIESIPFVVDKKDEGRGDIVATGRVTSCIMQSSGHYRLGIFFEKIDKADVAFLDAFIKSKERRKDPRWNMKE